MLLPNSLQKGDLIRIVSPAGKVDKEKILPAVNLLSLAGYKVVLGKHVFDNYFQFSGKDEDRLIDLQEALDDPDCNAIICARGGYGSVRIADKIDFSSLKKYPKWLIGFSDVTVLHMLMQKHGVCSIHGAMPGFYLNDGEPTESFQKLIQMLEGERLTIESPSEELNRRGISEGKLVGGNLSIITSLLGTTLEPDTDGEILFIEDLSEYLYHLDRMMHSLKLSGKLAKLKGLVVGQFTEMKDNDSPFGQSVEEIIFNAVKEYDYPVCFNFPVGHVDRNLPLMLGVDYRMVVNESNSLLQQL